MSLEKQTVLMFWRSDISTSKINEKEDMRANIIKQVLVPGGNIPVTASFMESESAGRPA